MSELIDRQAAIDAIQKAYVDTEGGEDRHAAWLNVGLTNALHIMQDLPSAQPEPCEDAVGRDAVVRFLDDWISALDANCHHQSMADLKIVKNDFKNLPSAQPMRKRGKWRWSEDMMCFICSECESGWKGQPTLMGKPLYEWCPVCGADMRGDEDE